MTLPPYYSIEARIASFNQPAAALGKSTRKKVAKGWPHGSNYRATPKTLAAAGWYFTGNAKGGSDEVQCFHCDKTLAGWDPQDDPDDEHAQRIAQLNCPWAIAVCSIAGDRDDDGASPSTSSWRFKSSDRLPTAQGLEQARALTFRSYWPHDSGGRKANGVTSKKMAQAGFVFTPVAAAPDMATCPYCKSAFDEWQPTDNPLALHEAKAPDCPIFTGRLWTGNGTEDESEAPPPAPTARKVSARQTHTRKASATHAQSQRIAPSSKPAASAPANGKSKRAAKAAPEPPAIEDDSEHEVEESAPPPPPPPKKPAAKKPAAKSAKPKKKPPAEEVIEILEVPEEADITSAMSDFDDPPAPKIDSHTRSRSQAEVQTQTLSRNPSKLRPDNPNPGPARSRSQQSTRMASVTNNRDRELATDTEAGVKLSRKKKAARAPSPEDDDEEEENVAEPEPEPTPVPKKSKSKTPKSQPKSKAAKKTETPVLDLPPPVATSSGERRKVTRKKATTPADTVVAEPEDDEMDLIPAPRPKGKKVVTPLREDAADSLALPEPPRTKSAKKATKGSASKSTSTTKKKATPKPKPDPVDEYEDEMDVDPPQSVVAVPEDVVASESDQHSPAGAEEEETGSASRSEEESADTELDTQPSETDDQDGQEERPNLPSLGSLNIAAAKGAIPAPNGMSIGQPSRSSSDSRKPLPVVSVPKDLPPSTSRISNNSLATPKQAPPPPPPKTLTPVRTPRQLRAIPKTLAGLNADALPTFTTEERAMTLEEFVTHRMKQEYERLRADGEREIAEFEAKAEEVRRRIEEL